MPKTISHFRNTFLLVYIFILIAIPPSNAQGLKALAKNKVSAGIKKGKSTPHHLPQSVKKLDFESSRFWPGVTMHSLLGPEGLQLTLDGKFRAPNVTFSFLPTKLEDGSPANFDGYKKEEILLTAKVFNTTTAKEAGEFHYTVNPVSKTFSYSNQQTAERRGYSPFIQLAEGSHEIKYYGSGIHFFTFSFEVRKVPSTDPYSVFEEAYFLKGPWERWAYLTVDDNNKAIRFHFYEENDNPNVENEYRQTTTKEVKYQAKIYRGEELLGGSGNRERIEVKTGNSVRSKWVEISTQLIHVSASASKQQQVTLDGLDDGHYTISLEVNDALERATKTIFPFTVKNGRLMGDSQATRGSHSDKYTFFEPGGREYTFIKSK